MTESIGILDLLKIRGFDPECRSKLVRHQDKRFDIPTLIRDGWFDLYQAHQARDIFGDCDYIVSFTGDGGTRAKFLGVSLEDGKSMLPLANLISAATCI